MGTHRQGRRAARGRGPRGRRYGLALALLAGVVFAGDAFATHPSWREQLQLNVDGDRARETVTATYDVSSDHKQERGSITARDTCAGRRRQVALVPAGRFTPTLALRPAQLGRAAVGVVADYREGSHLAQVVRLRSCRVQVLLSFRTPAAASLKLETRNDSARFPGREVVAVEGLRDAARSTFFRWVPASGRYVKYKTTFSAV
jgi:hypothetical protein